jgi:uncharacterized protein YutE (UPF0331/DUF86 family)
LSLYQQIIAFRNFLVHAYADVDDRMVRELIQTRLAPLTLEVDALLSEG